jgi:hypothetical protein
VNENLSFTKTNFLILLSRNMSERLLHPSALQARDGDSVGNRYGALANIDEGYQGCPLYPYERTFGRRVGPLAVRNNATLEATSRTEV